MFKCQKCHEISYSRYEEYIYVCQDCKRFFRICCDCFGINYHQNNISILKEKFHYLFKYIVDRKYYLQLVKKDKKISKDIINIIWKYIDTRYICNKSLYSFNNFQGGLNYIIPFGLQLTEDDESSDHYSFPIFYCNNCANKYEYYCAKYNKLKK